MQTKYAQHLHDSSIWVVKLSDGQTIYQDDVTLNSSWKELKDYLKNRDVHIYDFYLKFRSHEFGWLEGLKEEERNQISGFFFRIGMGGLVMDKLSSQWTQYVVGHVINNKIYIQTLITPHLTVLHSDIYDIDKDTEEDIIYGKGRSLLSC